MQVIAAKITYIGAYKVVKTDYVGKVFRAKLENGIVCIDENYNALTCLEPIIFDDDVLVDEHGYEWKIIFNVAPSLRRRVVYRSGK